MKIKILSILLLMSVSCLFSQIPEPTRQYMFSKWSLINTGSQPGAPFAQAAGYGFSHTEDFRGYPNNALKLGGSSFWTAHFVPTIQNSNSSDVFNFVISFWIKTQATNKNIIKCWANREKISRGTTRVRGTQGIRISINSGGGIEFKSSIAHAVGFSTGENFGAPLKNLLPAVSGPINDGTWHHVAIRSVRDSNLDCHKYAIYIDGQPNYNRGARSGYMANRAPYYERTFREGVGFELAREGFNDYKDEIDNIKIWHNQTFSDYQMGRIYAEEINGCSDIINIPDSNLKQALINNIEINIDGDDQICRNEAERYTGKIELIAKGIVDFTGMQAFKNAYRINCINNDIRSINLTQNKGLKEFYCYGNPNLTSLNIANGRNGQITHMEANNNPSLTCIQKDPGYTPSSGWKKSSGASWSNDCSSTWCNTPVNIPDQNFKAALLDLGVGYTTWGASRIDTNYDGIICQSEAAAYTGTIMVNNKGITDFTGLEAFVNATRIDIGKNLMTTVDLSNLTTLPELYCYNNPNLTSLDLSDNTGLTLVACGTNTNLQSLNIANNNNANITYFNASGNTNLGCIQIDPNFTPPNFNNSNNTGWKKDASTIFTDDCAPCSTPVVFGDSRLKNHLVAYRSWTGWDAYRIDTNNDGEICVSEARAYTGTINLNSLGISDFTGLEHFVNAFRLDVGKNPMTSIDLSTMVGLKELYCYEVPNLISLDLTTNINLEKVSVRDNSSMTSLNIANGHNANIIYFDSTGSSNLSCIQIDRNFTPPNFNNSTNTGWKTHGSSRFSHNCASSCTNILSIPDDNLRNALLAHGTSITGTNITPIDTDGDGEICVSEARNYQGKIDVSSKNITNYRGLEEFIATKELNISNNPALTVLDISANIAMTKFNASNCSLSTLNVVNGNNSAFRNFDIRNNYLSCVQVDPGFTSTQFWLRDANVTFGNSCTFMSKVYVDKNATGDNDGSSWTDAFTDLKLAIRNIDVNGEIWIAKGKYNLSGKTDSYKIVKNGISLYGGFNGTETNLANRDILNIHSTNETILSGDVDNNDGSSFTNRTDNAYRVMNILANNFMLDGVTISGGHAVGSASDQKQGSAIKKLETVENLTIRNCLISDNYANNNGTILATSSVNGTFKIHNSIIKGNRGGNAMGIYAYTVGQGSNNYEIKIENNLFQRNTALHYAGSAMWLRAEAPNSTVNATIVNNTFYDNRDLQRQSSNNITKTPVGLQQHPTNGANLTALCANNIFWNNRDSENGGNLTVSIANLYRNNLKGDVTIKNSIAEDGFTNYTNISNISTLDPMFRDVANDDFMLEAGSPALDTGDNLSISQSITTDLSGRNRIEANLIDMGCYEVPAVLNVAITNTSLTAYKGFRLPMNSEVSPTLASQKVTWSVSNTNVATIDTNGVLTPLTQGTVMVTATSLQDTSKSKTVTLTVLPEPTAIYVDQNATGMNNGTSWINAFTDLQDAISVLDITTNKTIWIAKGTYKADSGNDKTKSFEFNIADVKVYGGFSGTETLLSERDYSKIRTVNQTILSGDLMGNDGANFTNISDNTKNMIKVLDDADNLLLDGFTISSGNLIGSGSAILKSPGANNLTVNNCIIEKNSSWHNTHNTGTGIISAANSDMDTDITITNNIIRNNRSGAGTFYFTSNKNSIVNYVTYANNLVYSNINVKYSGSALWLRADKGQINAIIVNNTIVGNADRSTASCNPTPIGLQQNNNNNGVMNTIFANNIIWGNTIATWRGTFNPSSGRSKSVSNVYLDTSGNTIGTISINNSVGEDNFSNISSNKTNVSSANPMFKDAANNDYSLQSGSPAIDSGLNSSIPSMITTDLKGNNRIVNTTVDMGAYEYILYNTFTGVTSADWSDAANWSSGSVPLRTDVNGATIATNATNNPVIQNGVNAEVNSLIIPTGKTLTIEDNGTLIATNHISGDVKYVRKNLSANKWYLGAAPLSGAQYNDSWVSNNSIRSGSGSNRAIAHYDNTMPTSSHWKYYQSGSGNKSFDQGVGYSFSRATNGSVAFEGQANNGDVYFDLTLGGTVGDNYNSLGNPYLSFLDVSTFLRNETSKLSSETIWLWNANSGTYETRVSSQNFKVAPGQGFLVDALSAARVTFKPSMQTTSATSTFMRSSSEANPKLRLLLSQEGLSRYTDVYFVDGTTRGFDNGYDGELFGGSSHKLSVYTDLLETNGKKYQIQSVPTEELNTSIIPIGVVADSGKELVFSLEKNHINETCLVSLEDRLLGEKIDISKGNTHKVVLRNQLNGTGRFYLHIKSENMGSDDDLSYGGIQMYNYQGVLEITGLLQMKAELSVFDVNGKEVLRTKVVGALKNKIALPNVSKGVYVVRLKTPEKVITKKIIF